MDPKAMGHSGKTGHSGKSFLQPGIYFSSLITACADSLHIVTIMPRVIPAMIFL
jgi:hypothetical protein